MTTSTTNRPFGYWTATALIMGGMIGSGIFLLPVALAPYGWTGVLAWIISIAGALCIGYAVARLTQSMPQESGVVATTGVLLGPMAAALVGWSYWVSVWAAVAAIAVAATSYLSVFVPALNATPLRGALTSVAILWALTGLNLAGAVVVGRFQVLTTVLKLLPLLVVAVILMVIVPTGEAPLPPLPTLDVGLTGLFAAVTLTLFPMLGFECAGMAAGRVRDPARTVMRATMVGTLLTGLIYIVVCSGIALTLPKETLVVSNAPFELFVQTWAGANAGLAIAAFAAIAAIGALNGWVLMQGEVPLGMARAGMLPAWFHRTGARDVPIGVLVMSSILASVLVLSNSSPTLGGVFTFLVLVTTSSSLWLYAAVCLAALSRRIAVPAALAGLIYAFIAMWGAGVEASGLSFLLMLTVLPLYWLRGKGVSQPAT
ncbi:MAG: APC family permease [Pseudomarimonas sp.]